MILPLWFLELFQVDSCGGILFTSLSMFGHWLLAHLLLSDMFFEKLHLLLTLWPTGLVLIRLVNDFSILETFLLVYRAFSIWTLSKFHVINVNHLDLCWFYIDD